MTGPRIPGASGHPLGLDAAPEIETDAGGSGRERFAWNVVTSWAGHSVFVVVGFILPRLIDRSIGQAGLGVWDFGWLLMSYFANMQLGIGVSVNRYVAREHAAGDLEGVRRTVSSVTAIDLVIGVAILAASWITALFLPALFAARLAEHTTAASWVIALLGTTLAVQTATDGFRGVITGLHRWDVHNAINSGFYAGTAAAMILALKTGHGLRGLALTYAVGQIAAEVARVVAAHHLLPGLRVRWRYVNAATARGMFVFGGKAFLEGVSRLLLIQGNGLVVTSFLGPSALAVFSRPSSLVRHADAFMAKFSHVFTPTASHLQKKGRERDLRELLMVGGRLASGLAIPMLAIMAVMADPILKTWMGVRYEHGAILAILAIGSFLPQTQQPTATILIGLNLHGRIAAVTAVCAILGLGFSVLAVGGWGIGMVGAAVAIAVPMSLMAIAIAIYACRALRIDFVEYARGVWVQPILCAGPFLLALIALRILLRHHPLAELLLSALAVPLLLAPFYWRYLLSAEHRQQLLAMVRRSI